MPFSNVVVTVSSDPHAAVTITLAPRVEAINTVNIIPQTAFNINMNPAPVNFYPGVFQFIPMPFSQANGPVETVTEPDTPMSIGPTPPLADLQSGSFSSSVNLSDIQQTDEDVVFLSSLPPRELPSLSNTGLLSNSPINLMRRHSFYGNDGMQYEWYEPFYNHGTANSFSPNQQ